MAEFFHCYVSSLGRNHFSQVGFVEDRIALKGIPLLKWRKDFNPTSPQAYRSPPRPQGKSSKTHSRTAIQVKVTSLGSLLWILPKWHFWRVCWSLDLSLHWCMEISDMKLHLECIPFCFRKSSTWHQNLVPVLVPEYTINQILPGSFSQKNNMIFTTPRFVLGDLQQKAIRNNHSQWINPTYGYFCLISPKTSDAAPDPNPKNPRDNFFTWNMGKPHGLQLESLILESLMWKMENPSNLLIDTLGSSPVPFRFFSLASCHGATFWVLQLRRWGGSNFEGDGGVLWRMIDM